MAETRNPSHWRAFEEFPPYYVRLLAKRVGAGRSRDLAIDDTELAIRSGIPLDRLREIYRAENWDSVTHGEILAYTVACNFDPTNTKDRQRVRQYLYVCLKRKVRPFQYLWNSPRMESEFLPLIQLLASRKKSSPASSPSPLAAVPSAA